MIAVCGVICGAEGWVEIEEFGKAKETWFQSWLALPNGIPSHDTLGRVFARLDPKQFEACFLQWVQSVSEEIKGVIAVDGKTLRRSHDRGNGKKALHMVSAWASANRMVLAQLATEEKSNEITAIPALLRQFALAGCIVTIDAMRAQTQIASQIIDQEGVLHPRAGDLHRTHRGSQSPQRSRRGVPHPGLRALQPKRPGGG